MTNISKLLRTSFTGCLVLVSLLSWGALAISAQTTTTTHTTDGKTPKEIAPGSPAGSYPLSDFDNINLYNQSLGFHLPLLRVGGRGSAGYTITLPIERKWRIDHTVYNPSIGCAGCDVFPPEHHYFPNPGWYTPLNPGFGAGVMIVRPTGSIDRIASQSCGPVYAQTLTRLAFIMPDGTEYELHDTLFGGTTKPWTGSCSAGANRGREFVTADGSTVTFIASADVVDRPIPMDDIEQAIFPISGDLFLPDGTRYHIQENQVVWIRDRNGNVVHTNPIVDSLGRTVTFSSASNGVNIHYKRVDGTQQRTITVVHAGLSTRLRQANDEHPVAETLKTFGTLFPTIPINGPGDAGFMNSYFDSDVVSEVVLPDNRKYEFYYNSYGELARVVLPTGGSLEYDYQAGDGVLFLSADEISGNRYEVFRRVVRRRVYLENGDLESVTTFGACDNASPGSGNSCVQVDQLDPNPPPESESCAEPPTDSGYRLISRSKHFYHGTPGPGLFTQPTDYAAWYEGREFRTETYACDGTTLLQRFEQKWRQRGNADWVGPEPANNPRVMETTTTLADSNQVSKQIYGYGNDLRHNNRTDVWEYDYGVGAASAYPMRYTHTDYLDSANGISYANPASGTSYTTTDLHIRHLARGQQVYAVNPANGTQTLAAQSEIHYDEPSYPLMTYETVTGWENPNSNGGRGLATTSRAWLNTTNTWLETHARYDQVGNVREAWDAKGNLSQVSYEDSFSDLIARNTFAFPTITTSAVPDPTPSPSPSSQHGSPTAFVATSVYDFWTGRVTSATDPNNQTTSVEYDDLLDRPTKVTRAVGTDVINQTTFDYDDANRTVTTTSDKDTLNDNLLKSQTSYDGLGRTVEARQYEDGTHYIATQQQYDALGRAYTTTNPFRPQSESPVWTTTRFDALGRVRTVKTPDGAVVATAYRGSQVLVTDPTGKQRMSQSNALGQLKDVWEITPNDPNQYPGIESVSFNGQSLHGFHTSYAYDSANDLTDVIQGSQTRTFAYDSLKRLLSATNPESGRICYGTVINEVCQADGYDANGNLIYKTDARGVVTSYAYDALNRNTSVSYTDDPANTPAVNRFYDGFRGGVNHNIPNSKGRLWQTETSGPDGSRTTSNSFDDLGRPTNQSQEFAANGAWSQPYTTQRTYDLASNVLTQTYPSGNTVNYVYDNAGRTSSFTGNLGEGLLRTYANEFKYTALGGVEQERFGADTPLYHKQRFNQRGQLWDMRLSTVSFATDPEDGDRGSLINYYSSNNNFEQGGSGADNNGNLLRQKISVPGSDFFQDDFAYDALNRLKSISERLNGIDGDTFNQAYTFDRWGNRRIDQANSRGDGINNTEFTVNPANNQLGVPVPVNSSPEEAGTMTYDAAGNLINDTYTGGGSREYDAENRMISADGGTSMYSYDGDGRRVRRPGNQWDTQTWQVYGVDGELLAEYSHYCSHTLHPTCSAWLETEYGYRNGQLLVTAKPDVDEDNTNVKWLVGDQLGTPRIVVDKSGSLASVSRHDYLPFGEELFAGGRTTTPGFSVTDGVRQKFTGYEHDNETGLEFAQARYLSSVQGRFTSTDPFMGSGRIGLPQSWNRYAYVLNNPMRLVDPTGLGDQDPPPPPPQKPPPPPPPTASPRQNSGLQIPTSATVTIGDPTVVRSEERITADGIVFVTGIEADYQITIRDQRGEVMTPDSGISIQESVTQVGASDYQIIQQSDAVEPDDNGVFHDVFGPMYTTNGPIPNGSANGIVQGMITTPEPPVTAEQRLTISINGIGPVATAVSQRTFTNVDSNGRLLPYTPPGGGMTNNYRFTTTPITVTPTLRGHMAF